MAERQYKIKLSDPSLPPGHVPASGLADIAGYMQLVAQRLARQLVGAEGRGRSPAALEQAARVMFTGVSRGSTVLECRLGDPNALNLEDSPDEDLGQRFDEVLQAIVSNSPPPGISPLVAEAAEKLARAFRADFPRAQIEISTPSSVVSCASEAIDSTVWAMSNQIDVKAVTVSGTLNRIDIRANAFRVTDTAGNDIALNGVSDAESFGPLIGKLVTAKGNAEFVNGRLTGLHDPVIEPLDLPPSWTRHEATFPVRHGGSFGAGVDGITDEEISAFLAAL